MVLNIAFTHIPMTVRVFIISILLQCVLFQVIAQNKLPLSPTVQSSGTFWGESKPLRDLPLLSSAELQTMKAKAAAKILNPKIRTRQFPYAKSAFPKSHDAVWQKNMGTAPVLLAPETNFEGQTSPSYPPDCNGTAGPNHFMQAVNSTYAIFDKTGAILAGPTNMNQLFGNVPGANCNDGDPIILFDDQADRWLAAEFSVCGTNDRMLIAISTTNDPTGTWYQYSFDVADMPDYEKFGVWHDGYYMGTNNGGNNDIYVFERSQMIIGGASPKMVGFTNKWLPTSIDGFLVVPPVDNDGPYAPAGAPGIFISMNDDAVGGGSDELWIYELAVDWANTANSTFTRTQQIGVIPFDSDFGNDWSNIKQKGTTQELDAIPQVIMNVPQYRNFGTYQTIVCCHTVDVDGTDHAGIRWYELRKTTGSWVVRQTGTYAPDANSRWMGSIMLNANNKIGLGYSVSGKDLYPGICYTGQTDVAYAAGLGVLDAPEVSVQTGNNAQVNSERWGDYSQMSVDPADNETFWFTTEYIGSGGLRKTKIASFKINNAPIAISVNATAITGISATLNGIVNPNSLLTTYYFEWGTSMLYGNTSSSMNAGSGSTNQHVTADITGLVAGTTYHFRIVASNSDGTTRSSDLSFTPGGIELSTIAVTGVTISNALSGGSITTDGGLPVTARGVCWSTTPNPLAAGNHTNDGTGIGTYTSTITTLSPSTVYYLRAYATNASKTYYGSEISFTTPCPVSILPYAESFSASAFSSCWSQVDYQGNGQIWQVGTITGQSPTPLLTGNYAYLNSRAYGIANTQNVDLVSPVFDMSTYLFVNLQFKHYFKSFPGSGGTLSYTTDNGITWNVLQNFTTSSATNPANISFYIPKKAGQNEIKFKWNYTGTRGYYWAIDDIQISGTNTGLAIFPITKEVSPAPGQVSFSVTSSSAWIAVNDAPWCTVTPSGTSNGTLTVIYDENAYAAIRNAKISVTNQDLVPVTTIITVSQQAPAATLSVTPLSKTVSYQSGTVLFDVTSNTSWSCSSNASWCQTNCLGLGNGIITATYQQNTTQATRTANIQVVGNGIDPVTVQVIQLPSLVSLDEKQVNQLKVYPNPTSGLFIISNSNTDAFEIEVSILTSNGKPILYKQFKGASNYTLDLSREARGNYLMRVQSKGKTLLIQGLILK